MVFFLRLYSIFLRLRNGFAFLFQDVFLRAGRWMISFARYTALFALAASLAAAFMLPSYALAQNPNADTSWATGMLIVNNIQTINSIDTKLYLFFEPLDSNANLPLIIDSMEWTNGEYQYSIPVKIDTTVGIEKPEKLRAKIIQSGKADMNVFFENDRQGNIEIFNMLGQLINEKNFKGNHVYIEFPEIKNGVYLYRITSLALSGDLGNVQSLSGKFIKTNASLSGSLSRPNSLMDFGASENSVANARLASVQADYILTIIDPDTLTPGTGYKIFKDTLTFQEGNNGLTFLYMTPRDPLTVDLIVRTWDLNGDTIKNSMVYLIDNQNNIDSLRTDSTGEIIFKDISQGKSFTVGVGGLKGFKNYEGFSITIPSNVHNYNDTILRKNFTLIPDTTFSGKNNVNTYIGALEFADMFGKFNIQSALDTTRVYLSNYFTSTEKNKIRRYLDSLYAWTGVPAIESNTAFTQQTNYNPYTTPHNLVGTNISPGTSNTQWNDYTMPGTGEDIRVNATMSVNSYSEQEFCKEWNRLQGRSETTIRTSNMNPVPSYVNDKDAVIMSISDALGKARFKYLKHDLTGTQTAYWLTDTSSVMNAMMPMIAKPNNNTNSSLNFNQNTHSPNNKCLAASSPAHRAWNYVAVRRAKLWVKERGLGI